MNKPKFSAVCGLSALTLIAGFGLAARPASALPTALSVTRLAAPVFAHGDSDRSGRQDRSDQDRRQYQENQHRDRENRRRDAENRRRDEENRRLNRENQRRSWEQNREQHRDRHDQGHHDYRGDQNRHRDDNRDNR